MNDRVSDFATFYSDAYTSMLRQVMYVGASEEQAHDAVQDTMIEVFRNWSRIKVPLAWARRAVVNNFFKIKMRDAQRLARTASGGHVMQAAYNDEAMIVWEDGEWVAQLLSKLSPAQREVLAFIIDGWKPAEIAELLGKSSPAVRKNLQLARDRLKNELQRPREQEPYDDSRGGYS